MKYFSKRSYQLVIIMMFLSMMIVNTSAQVALTTQHAPSSELLLAEAGPHDVGLLSLNFVNTNRDNQINNVIIWYPAISNGNFTSDTLISDTELSPGSATLITTNTLIKEEPTRRAGNLGNVEAGSVVNVIAVADDWAQIEYGEITGWVSVADYANLPEVDAGAAPYPLILYSEGVYENTVWRNEWLMQHLASYGFVVASVNSTCHVEPTCAIDRELDILFVLDQLANLNDGHLQGMIDGNNVGVGGFVMGGHTALASAGASIDPEFFRDFPNLSTSVGLGFELGDDNEFDVARTEITDYLAEMHGTEQGSLYPSITDQRIHAVLSIAPWISSMYGPEGLDEISTPTLALFFTDDAFVLYEQEVVPIYSGWENENRQIVTLINNSQAWNSYPADSIANLKHLSTAWFGYYLQGREDYQAYLSEDSINSFSDMIFGLNDAE